ncbi:MAG: hypothetical protein MJE68_01530 [Proteobacteria bacterium]|nr:hypothetical protein [Pseudomonadota bacterium]
MAELQAMKDAAQVEMDRQRTDYEIRISQLSKDMVSQRTRHHSHIIIPYSR